MNFLNGSVKRLRAFSRSYFPLPLAIAAATAFALAGCSAARHEAVRSETRAASPPAAAGCSSARHEAVRSETRAATPPAAAGRQGGDSAAIDRAASPEAARTLTWKPHFIATGYASGIMVEFTGMKNDKPVNAKFASIEVRPAAEGSAAKTFTSGINALRQAFFELPPGRYIVRQTRTWAEQAPIHTVEVREGHYSLVPITVINPKSPKQISDRLGE